MQSGTLLVRDVKSQCIGDFFGKCSTPWPALLLPLCFTGCYTANASPSRWAFLETLAPTIDLAPR